MAKTLSARVGFDIGGVLVNALDIGEARYPFAFGPTRQFTNGAGANQASAVFSDTRTLVASATEDLDLNGTALQDALGANLALTKIKAIAIVADASNTNDVIVGGAASNAVSSLFGDATDTLRIKPGGFALLCAPTAAGYGVTAATADLLKIANSAGGTPVTYTIIIIGA
jgi:hypothetical protein